MIGNNKVILQKVLRFIDIGIMPCEFELMQLSHDFVLDLPSLDNTLIGMRLLCEPSLIS